MESINSKIAVGVLWAVFARLSVKLIGLVSTVILARLLFPSDFGVIALCLVVVSFLEIFVSFGFDLNIIQRSNVDKATLDSAWTCKVASSAVISLILYLSSDQIGAFFDDERLVLLTQVLSLLPLINGAENIGFVLFRKEMDLKKEFDLLVLSKFISFVVTVTAAYLLKSYWALVAGLYTQMLSMLAISYWMHPYRPALSLTEAASLFRFSKWILLNNLLIFFNHKVTDIVIGKEAGTTQLGYYSVGYEVSNIATTELIFPMSRAVFPGYAKLKDDLPAFRDTFIKINQLVVYISAPICFGIAVCSDELVRLFLGDRWLEVIPIISVLAFYGFSRCAVQNVGGVFVALGRPATLSFISLFRLFLVVPFLVYFVSDGGALAASYVILGASFVTVPIAYFLVAKLLKLEVRDILLVFLFPLLSAVLMYFLVAKLGSYLETIEHYSQIFTFAAKILFGIAVYVALSLLYIKIRPCNNVVKVAIDTMVSYAKRQSV